MGVINNIKQLKENNFFIFIPKSNKLEPIKKKFLCETRRSFRN